MNPPKDLKPRQLVGVFYFDFVLHPKKCIFKNMDKTIEYKGDLILLRGLPGSGKTTLGNVILKCLNNENSDVISDEDFFINENGMYIYDSSRLKEAHNNCLIRCVNKMKNEILKIVVANNFIEISDMERYYEAADRYGYRVHSVVVENRHFGKTTKDIPDEKIKSMKDTFDLFL